MDGRAIRAVGDLSFVATYTSQSATRSAISSVAFARSRSCAFIVISSMRPKRSAVETELPAELPPRGGEEGLDALGTVVSLLGDLNCTMPI